MSTATKKNLSWSERRTVGVVMLTTPNGSKPIEVRFGVTDEGKDSFAGKMQKDGRSVTLPYFSDASNVVNYTLTAVDGDGEADDTKVPFTSDYQRTNTKKDKYGNVIEAAGVRMDRVNWTASVDIEDMIADKTVTVTVRWSQTDDGFVPSVSARYRSDGERGAKKVERIDSGDF